MGRLIDAPRRLAIGAEFLGDLGTHFRVWAPSAERVAVVRRKLRSDHEQEHVLEREPDGYFSALVPDIGPGTLYSFRLDGGEPVPDPASRFQPLGPHGPSEVVDPERFRWKHRTFAGPPERGQVAYELHVGTFTREGTYTSALAALPKLAELGVTTIELMPLADFPGAFGWGYDGAALWAPSHLYGQPDELRALVDGAHGLGLAVILDVVYNHFGPDGNYLDRFSADYFTDRHANEWGKALNFDGPNSSAVREFFCANAAYWIEEYRFDGLRLDATQSIIDDSPRHVLCDITDRARAAARQQNRRIFIAAENEPQNPQVVAASEDGGFGCDALWNDDFHHAAVVALTGRREAYYRDYRGSPQELMSALKWGFLFQGQYYYWQSKGRGQASLGLEAHRFVTYLENHDQVANSLRGDRLATLANRAALRAMTTLWLLSPPTPMLFQGQEYGTTTPFLYFADHHDELGEKVQAGRREFLTQFQSIAHSGTVELRAPNDAATFERCKLEDRGGRAHDETWALHRDLLTLRRTDPAFSSQRADLVHGAVLTRTAFVMRFFCERGDRLIVVNLGGDIELDPAPEPLLAPPAAHAWKLVFSSEDVKYGGSAHRAPHVDGRWALTAASAHVLVAEART